jgi:hypothetical protein
MVRLDRTIQKQLKLLKSFIGGRQAATGFSGQAGE